MAREINYANIIPLIGGMTMANKEVVGHDPYMIMSYTPFASNDSHIVKRLPNVPYINLDEDLLPKYVPPLDFVSSVCPCAGLSMYSSGKRGHGASQNKWMYESTEFVLSKLMPTVLFGENAPGLFTSLGENVGKDLFEIGRKYGYAFTIYRTNTNRHGIPQNRPRTFYFFWRGNEAPLMRYYDRPKKPLAEYLAEIPENALYHSAEDKQKKRVQLEGDYTWAFMHAKFGEGWREKMKEGKNGSIFDFVVQNKLGDVMVDWLKDHGYTKGSERVAAIVEKVAAGGNYWDNSLYYFPEEFNALIGRSMDSVHPTEERAITLREAMWLMGLPHDFEITDLKLQSHVTQNVPVTTAADMTREVVAFVNGELPMSGASYVKQDNLSHKVDIIDSACSLEDFFE